jgi:hypothetical protein
MGLLLAPAVLAAPTPSPSTDPQQGCRRVPPRDPQSVTSRISCDVATGGPGGPVKDVTQSAGQAAQQAGQGVADATETAFTTWLANGAIWVVQNVEGTVMGPSTTPNLDPTQAAAFAHVYGRVVGVALSLSVLLVLIGIIEATLTQRPGGLRRVVVGIAVAGIGLGAVPVGTAILVRIVDDLSQYVAGDETQVVAHGLGLMVQVMQQTNPSAGAAAFAVTCLGVMLGGGLLWLELVTRAALIYLFLGVVPLACAAVQWPRLEGVLRQVLFAGLALILSKLVIAVALSVGFAVMGSALSLQTLIAGMFIVVIAGLMPFATARVLPLAAEELAQAHGGRVRRGVAGGVGRTARVVAAAAAGGPAGAGAAILGVAPPMGSSGGSTGSGSGGWTGPRSPGSGGPDRAGQQVAAAGASSAEAGSSSQRPGTGPVEGQVAPQAPGQRGAARRGGVPRPAPPPPSRPRGPEPPPDAGAPPAT